MPGVAVVTDSTHYLPPEVVAARELHVVSLYVKEGGEQRREAELTDLGAFYERLRTATDLPTTSQPSIGDFAAVYEPLVAAGRDVVSIHVAGGISGTVESARQAAADVAARSGRRLDVVDSQMGCGALGLIAWPAAVATQEGADPVGAAEAWLGGALKIKPILTLEGEITPVERVRTSGRAFERLVVYMSSRRSDGADGWVVQHIRADDGAARLVERGRALFGCEPLFVSEIGPVIGAHVGPGLLGVGGLPRALVGA